MSAGLIGGRQHAWVDGWGRRHPQKDGRQAASMGDKGRQVVSTGGEEEDKQHPQEGWEGKHDLQKTGGK